MTVQIRPSGSNSRTAAKNQIFYIFVREFFYGGLVQRKETARLERVQCGFESLSRYHNVSEALVDEPLPFKQQKRDRYPTEAPIQCMRIRYGLIPIWDRERRNR